MSPSSPTGRKEAPTFIEHVEGKNTHEQIIVSVADGRLSITLAPDAVLGEFGRVTKAFRPEFAERLASALTRAVDHQTELMRFGGVKPLGLSVRYVPVTGITSAGDETAHRTAETVMEQGRGAY